MFKIFKFKSHGNKLGIRILNIKFKSYGIWESKLGIRNWLSIWKICFRTPVGDMGIDFLNRWKVYESTFSKCRNFIFLKVKMQFGKFDCLKFWKFETLKIWKWRYQSWTYEIWKFDNWKLGNSKFWNFATKPHSHIAI